MMKELKMKPAVFLDRDGVINRDNGYILKKEDIYIFPYVRECVLKLHELGYYVIVVSNQSGIARGYLTEEELRDMNEYVSRETGVDAIYYCPYHEDGIVPEFTRKSDCRKPGIGMIRQACSDYLIDMRHSVLAGDRATDILTGQNAGIRTILLESGFGTARLEQQVEPDYILNDLRDVVVLCEEILEV